MPIPLTCGSDESLNCDQRNMFYYVIIEDKVQHPITSGDDDILLAISH